LAVVDLHLGRLQLRQWYNPKRRHKLRGPVNSPPEAGSIRHPRPVETATPGRRHRAVRRGKLPLTNNFIWKEEKSSIRIFLL
jgi:hypothetical protein